MTTDEKLDLILEKLDQLNKWQQVIQYAESNNWNPDKVLSVMVDIKEKIIPIANKMK